MADLRGFARRMGILGERVESNADRIVRKVALVVDAAVVLQTPVDTGRARVNWQVELGGPAGGTLPAPQGGNAAQVAIDAGKATIAQHKSGQAIHITNNLPYIGRLNDGSSAQAPAGFVETAIHQGVAAVRGASILVEGGRNS